MPTCYTDITQFYMDPHRSSKSRYQAHAEHQPEVKAAVVLQKVIRGHLTRNKLREALELYASIFSELEEDGDNFQISWQHNDKACWPTATLAIKPNQTNNEKASCSTAKLVLEESTNKFIEESLLGVESLLSEFTELSASANHQPKPSSSQPSISIAKRKSMTTVSHSSLSFTPSAGRRSSSKHISNSSSCKLCKQIDLESCDPSEQLVVQTLRSRSRKSDIWLPSGTPATALDGTMYRKKSCCRVSTPECSADSWGVREVSRSYANLERQRSRSSCDHSRSALSSTQQRDRPAWPRSGIRPSTTRSPTCASSAQTTPSSSPTHSPRSRRSAGRKCREIKLNTSATSVVTDSGVQTSGATTTHASVQTVVDVAIQTDTAGGVESPPITTTYNSISPPSLADACTQVVAKMQAECTASNTGTCDAATEVPDTPLTPVQEDDKPGKPEPVDQSDATISARLGSHESSQMDLTNVSVLLSPEKGASPHLFLPNHGDSSTPLRPTHHPNRTNTSQVNSSQSESGKVYEAASSQQQTSLWRTTSSPSHTRSRYEIKADTTPEELKSLRENMAMELMWIEQAIASRKQYLSLVEPVKEAPTKL